MKITKILVASIAAASLIFGFSSCRSKSTPAPSDYGGGVSDYSYTTGK
ncbi:MAG: hypothetical protein AAGA58_09115 [Verrucomicrobiota bacterium]